MSTSLKRLLAKPTKPITGTPITWIKANRRRRHPILGIPPCFICGRSDDDVVWYNCQTGGVRCLECKE
jgi:hypothetical protein